ncbi:MAG: 30S ribosome-binding factor RbfA [Finegoldia sp.]|nr:30S ribosome-binding factor RbfA [Finegoldia sp.]
MNKKRTQRIASEIQKIVSNSIINQIKDPRIDKINTSITGVEVTNDLSYATIYFSTIGDDKAKEDTKEGLISAGGFLRKEIGENVDLRHTPRLIFKLDNTSEHAQHINNLIEEIHKEDNND